MDETTKLPIQREKRAAAEAGYGSFDRMRREMDRLFNEMGRGFFLSPSRWSMPELAPLWQKMGRELEPVVDFVERPDRYEITAELPGMDEKNIEVRLAGGNLIVSGEKREEKEEKDANYHMSERRYGSFQRSLPLPDGIDAGRISATFQKGVLTVSLPKTEEAKKETKIDVKSA
jgi:HSP20 family protein